MAPRQHNRGEGRLNASFQTTENKFAYAEQRGASLGLTGHQYMRAVYNWWLLSGARPIDIREERGVPEMSAALISEINATNIFKP